MLILIAEALQKPPRENKNREEYAQAMTSSCNRMEEIIRKMCMITSYRIKDYADGIKILDFDRSAQGPEGGAR